MAMLALQLKVLASCLQRLQWLWPPGTRWVGSTEQESEIMENNGNGESVCKLL